MILVLGLDLGDHTFQVVVWSTPGSTDMLSRVNRFIQTKQVGCESTRKPRFQQSAFSKVPMVTVCNAPTVNLRSI